MASNYQDYYSDSPSYGAEYPYYGQRDPYGNVINYGTLHPPEEDPGFSGGGASQGTPTQPIQPPPVADPWATAPTDGNWQAWFLNNVQGLTPNSASLISLEPKLTPHGIKVLRNAQGIAGKIQLPDGSIVDVGRSFSGGNPGAMGWQWLTGDGGADGPPIEVNPEYLAPFTEQFVAPTPTAPFEFSLEDFYTDPGYQWRMKEGIGQLENSAAARGLINSGGTLKDLIDFNSGAASQEYNSAWQRAMGKWGTDYQVGSDAYNRARGEWMDRQNLWFRNQNEPWSKLYQAGSLGGQAARG